MDNVLWSDAAFVCQFNKKKRGAENDTWKRLPPSAPRCRLYYKEGARPCMKWRTLLFSCGRERERKRINDYGHICTSYLQAVHEKFCVERQSRHFILIYNPAQDRRVNTFSIERSRNPRKGILVGERLFPLNWSWIWEINCRVKMFYAVGKKTKGTC